MGSANAHTADLPTELTNNRIPQPPRPLPPPLPLHHPTILRNRLIGCEFVCGADPQIA